jgi:radical SAM protein with 4Fe4S-binding SPASM domain
MLNRLKELKLELTQECPLACVHCSTNSSRKQHSALPADVVFRILREGAVLGVERVVFTGGEPLVSPYLVSAVETATTLGLASTVYTTGIVDNRLTPISQEAAADLGSAGLKRFIFSVYSDRASTHDSITRYGSHAATLVAIRRALETSVPVEMHFVAMRTNFRDLTGLVRLASELGIERVSVLRFVPQGRARNIAASEDLLGIELEELATTITGLREQFPKIAIRAGSPFNILGLGNTPCNAADDVLVINHRGDIFPCDAFKNVRYTEPEYGSVLHHSLADVWSRSDFLSKVRGVLAGEKAPSCQSCVISNSCQSGCLAQKVIRNGWSSVDVPDPNCLRGPSTPTISRFGSDSILVQITTG